MKSIPWTKKYSPKTSKEIYGQNKAVETLKNFIKNYKSQKIKASLLYGEPGCGKTSSVYAIAKELDLELHEVNASDVRNKNSINQLIGSIIGQQSLFFKEKIILIDEIDGISGTKDRGGVIALLKLIKNSTIPIILTANNPYDKKFSGLRKKSLMIEFNSLKYPTVFSLLQTICNKENIKYDNMALTAIARRAGGDLRGAIIDLQTLTQKTKKLSMKDLEDISDRKKTESMVGALIKIFKTKIPEVSLSSFNSVNENMDERILWIEENLPKEYKKSKDLAKGFDALSLADVYRKRIKRWQYWRYLVYINDLLTAGISLAKDEKYPGFTKYMPTKRILKLWQAKMKFEKRKAIAIKVAAHTHTSTKNIIKDTIPYLKEIFKKGGASSKNIAKELKLSNDEIDWLKK